MQNEGVQQQEVGEGCTQGGGRGGVVPSHSLVLPGPNHWYSRALLHHWPMDVTAGPWMSPLAMDDAWDPPMDTPRVN